MNEIYKWLLSRKDLSNKIRCNNLTKIKDNSDIKNKMNNINKKRIKIEIEGEPRIKRNNLTARSTPIILDINLKLNNENKDSRCMAVEWELIEDEIMYRKNILNINNRIESDYEDSKQVFGDELKISYLSKHKRIYLEEKRNIKKRIINSEDNEFELKENSMFNKNNEI